MATTALPSDKRAERVARAIEDRIIAMGWPVGRLIGSEQSLMAEHDASRGVLREAVRLLEHHGTARMRRGPGGGLVVQAPSPNAVRRSASLFLQYRHTELSSLLHARTSLELNCLDLLAEQVKDPHVANELRQALEAELKPVPRPASSFHHVMMQLCGNPAIGLFAQTLMDMHGEAVRSHDHPSDPESAVLDPGTGHRAHQQIFDALLAGDLPLARRVLIRHLDDVAAATLVAVEEDSAADEELLA